MLKNVLIQLSEILLTTQKATTLILTARSEEKLDQMNSKYRHRKFGRKRQTSDWWLNVTGECT